MKQPNLGYADVKLDFACMHPAGSACRVSLCVYYDLCGLNTLETFGSYVVRSVGRMIIFRKKLVGLKNVCLTFYWITLGNQIKPTN